MKASIDPLESYLEIQSLDAHSWVISQGQGRARTHSYLVEGRKQAVLIDTGLGLINMKEITNSLTKKDVMVINTHGHLDHISANHQYDQVYLHPNDNQVYQEHGSTSFRRMYFNSYYHDKGLTTEDLKQPENHSRLKAQVEIPYKAVQPLMHQQIFDLGNRRLLIIPTPGHTSGSICVLDITYHYLFSGDSICEAGVLLNFPYSCSATCFLQSLEKLNHYIQEFDVIYAGHQTMPLTKEWLKEYMECCKQLIEWEKSNQQKDMEITMRYGKAQITYRAKKGVNDNGSIPR